MPIHVTTTQSIQLLLLLLLLLLHLLPNTSSTSPLHPDARALLAFKSKADPSNKLKLPLTNFTYCRWKSIQCDLHGKIYRFVLQDFSLGGIFAPDSLSRLDQLRVLSLQNNSLTGPIPDLSGLLNLKNIFLSHNSFTGSFPLSISYLHRLKTLDFSYNNLTGPIPIWIIRLDRLCYLRLESNRFNGSVPVLNQSSLVDLDLSRNNLSGAVPVTPALLRFGPASFSWNPGLCGEIVGKECHSSLPFFPSTVAAPPPPAVVLGQMEALRGVEVSGQSEEKHERIGFILGFSCGLFGIVVFLLCFVVVIRKRRSTRVLTATMVSDVSATSQAAAVTRMEEDNELGEKVKKVQAAKSGCIVFCAGESQLYTVEQLMSASAELLGRGSIGTTYKAVLDNRLIICVKRLDAAKTIVISSEMFERHMAAVGGLRHPNLVPLRAYLQAKEERLLVYDYQPNGSVLSLIHGSKSTRAKPLHWTSCLKIADDVAQGLSYIHQAWRLVHGNLKSSNILLGADFEACLTDYCLNVLVGPSAYDDPSYDGYRAPETRKSSHHSTTKSDVYAFGILLLELLTATPPSQHPFQLPDEVVNWVKGVREDDGVEDCMLGMLLEIAIACSAASPEQRPSMWQVLKMIQEIKDTVLLGDDE